MFSCHVREKIFMKVFFVSYYFAEFSSVKLCIERFIWLGTTSVHGICLFNNENHYPLTIASVGSLVSSWIILDTLLTKLLTIGTLQKID